ncbi:Lrp/AsnC family transcriptional regulator [Agromyces aerolatus]|uniref:Lrp/AsnC family transcriptional regulator n=1 Tax=Agromyces sp. LY-1074 TaxID=3074080 RepID=UPI00285F1458|nr:MULTISPECIES: Lrp/AsnC family transcriptional regulator [unclassified Agromyces]MDR5699453.1 Lrp/AsnC family transcriptional regulator [Agromyces sp. LY-1074]MDR5705749.1 Lrp/AsnC family transcriptional regulator [Agromyces sp. LY-1358]
MSHSLDDVDRRILHVLRRDARTSVNEVAREAAVSRANAYARVKRMTDAGVIVGYRVQTDPVSEGFHTSAYVALWVDQERWQELRTQLLALPEVEHVALVGGEFDVLVLVRARDNRDLRRIVLERMQSLDGVNTSRTFLIFEDYASVPDGGD